MIGSTAQPAIVERRINIVQGEQEVTNLPEAVLTTLLGSCVAACLWDKKAGVGGMNHFLLPGESTDNRAGTTRTGNAMRYGTHAMELLINALLRAGAQRSRLEAKLFGGARMMKGLTDVGAQNAAFAERFLSAEGIPVIGGSLRGERGRRIQFWPVSGRVRQIVMESGQDALFKAERAAVPAAQAIQGAVELF